MRYLLNSNWWKENGNPNWKFSQKENQGTFIHSTSGKSFTITLIDSLFQCRWALSYANLLSSPEEDQSKWKVINHIYLLKMNNEVSIKANNFPIKVELKEEEELKGIGPEEQSIYAHNNSQTTLDKLNEQYTEFIHSFI
jgi:hypothetical protein